MKSQPLSFSHNKQTLNFLFIFIQIFAYCPLRDNGNKRVAKLHQNRRKHSQLIVIHFAGKGVCNGGYCRSNNEGSISRYRRPSYTVNAGESAMDSKTHIVGPNTADFPVFPHDNPNPADNETRIYDTKITSGQGKCAFLFFDGHVAMLNRNRVPAANRTPSGWAGAGYCSFWKAYDFKNEDF